MKQIIFSCMRSIFSIITMNPLISLMVKKGMQDTVSSAPW